MALIEHLVEAADYWVTKLIEDMQELGINAVHYGDQERLETSPVVCVEPDTQRNELNGIPRRVRTTLGLYFIIYHAKIQSPQVNRREADETTKTLVNYLHADPRMNDTVIHCMVTRVESGYVYKQNTLVRATRILFEAETQAQLPN